MAEMRLVVAGAGGRMGRTLVKAIADSKDFALVGALEDARSPLIGWDAGVLAGLPENGVKLTGDAGSLLAKADGIVDFTAPSATLEFAALVAKAGKAHIIGTTGLSTADEAKIKDAAKSAVIVKSGNMLMQSEKDGIEVDQGIFLAHTLALPEAGMHLCEAMLRPKQESLARVDEFVQNGVIDFGPARIERQGKAAVVTVQNPRFLNAEDDDTLGDTETAADIAILDPLAEICVLRGGVVDHPKYKGRKIFSSGINLTHIYRGKIPYLWYIRRDMGVVNKIFRGIATGAASPDEIYGGTREKPWIATVDGWAIGGGCQYLLAMDYVIAGSDAYMVERQRQRVGAA